MLIDKQLLNLFDTASSFSDLNLVVANLISNLDLEIEVVGNVPKNKPILLISNHPGAIDSFLLSKFIDREDYFFIGITKFIVLGSEIEKILLPIYNKEKFDEKILNIILKLIGKKIKNNKLSQDQRRQKNRSTIKKAAKLITNSNLVAIFPAGVGGKSLIKSNWKAGVGFLARQIENKDALVVFANITGTKPTDYIIFASKFFRKIFYKPKKIKIVFSKPISLFKVINRDDDGKTIALNLEKLYIQLFDK